MTDRGPAVTLSDKVREALDAVEGAAHTLALYDGPSTGHNDAREAMSRRLHTLLAAIRAAVLASLAGESSAETMRKAAEVATLVKVTLDSGDDDVDSEGYAEAMLEAAAPLLLAPLAAKLAKAEHRAEERDRRVKDQVAEILRLDAKLAEAERERDAVVKAAEGEDGELLALSLTWIQGDAPGDWEGEFIDWYKPNDWPLGRHRAVSAFLARKFRESEAREAALVKALVDSALPYEALLMDAGSRKWIAPEVWAHIERTALATRALLAQKEATNG